MTPPKVSNLRGHRTFGVTPEGWIIFYVCSGVRGGGFISPPLIISFYVHVSDPSLDKDQKVCCWFSAQQKVYSSKNRILGWQELWSTTKRWYQGISIFSTSNRWSITSFFSSPLGTDFGKTIGDRGVICHSRGLSLLCFWAEVGK